MDSQQHSVIVWEYIKYMKWIEFMFSTLIPKLINIEFCC